MSLGAGAVYATSIRQKLITKCSPEAELVAVDAEAIQEASPERRCQCHMCALNPSDLSMMPSLSHLIWPGDRKLRRLHMQLFIIIVIMSSENYWYQQQPGW
jgi:hypothetical protein